MDEELASAVVDMWSRGSGVVARGPKMLLSIVPAQRSDVERHTGRRLLVESPVWRLEVSGRFLASGGVVYPGGVPFPEELHDQTAVIANEVWLYVDDDGDVLGSYWWPDAVRRPIASIPRDDFPPDDCVHPDDASRLVDVVVPIPTRKPWEPAVAVRIASDEVLVFCTVCVVEPLNEMVVYENGGISARAKCLADPPDHASFLRAHQPPYRRVVIDGVSGIGRDTGRSLGPQTWPWPGEVRWWRDGVLYEVKGFEPVATLLEIAASITTG
jgi:hypothetical protein